MRLVPHKSREIEFVPIGDLRSHPLFASLPYKYLEYHDRTVVRRRYRAGDTVCREGDYGATAFLIIAGEFEIIIEAPAAIVIEDETPGPVAAPPPPSPPPRRPIILTREDVILGEMSCLSHHPRTATIEARADDCEMWEIRRNFLDALRRNRASRAILDTFYRQRAVPDLLRRAELFARLPDAERESIVAYLRPRVDLVRVDPGRIVFEEGQPADDFYLVRLGFVKVARSTGSGEERVLDYLGPNTQFGEIGLLTSISADYLKDGADAGLFRELDRGTRTASVSALDEVELVRVQGDDFHHLARRFPGFRDEVVRKAGEYIRKNAEYARRVEDANLSLALAPGIGLYNANSLLVLDLEKCTRCDECTKACADSHAGVSRLVREGIRFDNFLVATSCRSCQNPYCMAGCPVDAIHRRPPTDERQGLEVVIEPWCIGCGRCAQNCPYGNINMHEYLEQAPEAGGAGGGTVRLRTRPKLAARVKLAGRKLLARINPRFKVRQKARVRAVTCDLCRDTVHKAGQEVACVHACPHDAAHRMSGRELIDLVRDAATF